MPFGVKYKLRLLLRSVSLPASDVRRGKYKQDWCPRRPMTMTCAHHPKMKPECITVRLRGRFAVTIIYEVFLKS